jgi:hypothetical protein
MARKQKQMARPQRDIAAENFWQGWNVLRRHRAFRPLLREAHPIRTQENLCPKDGWAVVTSNGDVHVHPTRRVFADELSYVLEYLMLILFFG